MKKIPSLFMRNYDGDRRVRNDLVPGTDWVIAGEGAASRKFDGTCCMVRDSKLYKRYDAKKGRTPPDGFEPAQPDADPITGHWPGWLLVGQGNDDIWHREAMDRVGGILEDGTYELCGPKIQGNPEGFDSHYLVRHGDEILTCPLSFDGIRAFLSDGSIEGIVWRHPDGRMAKIKGTDFGIKRKKINSLK